MSRWTAIAKLVDEMGKHEGRACPRFIARKMSCGGSGTVMDFSASGLRVQFSKNPKMGIGDQVDLHLESQIGQHEGRAEVMRIEKLGFRKFEVGFRFTDPEAAKKMQLFKSGFDTLEDGHMSAA